MRPILPTPEHERGTALLSVLLLVAVMAVVAATALERISLSTRLAANVASAQQSRWWLDMGEQVALTQLARANEADPRAFSANLGIERSVTLPDGQEALLVIQDATNCFNLNGLVRGEVGGTLRQNPRAVRQFEALLVSLGLDAVAARGLAARTADAIDSDRNPLPFGGETSASGDPLPNRAFASGSEMTVVEGVDSVLWSRIRDWVCALPVHEPTALNINSLPPERAELVAMLAPDVLSPDLVRSRLSARPVGGFPSVDEFWERGGWDPAGVPGTLRAQAVEGPRFVALHVAVGRGDMVLEQSSLIERGEDGPRLRARLWGSGATR